MPATSTPNAPDAPDADAPVRAVVRRLARPHRSGGYVIECAAILAEGGDRAAILEWVTAHAGVPEAAEPVPQRGLHGSRLDDGGSRRPLRYLLPAGALT